MNSTTVLSLNLFSGSLVSVINRVKENVAQNTPGYICAANVHMSVLAQEDEEFRDVIKIRAKEAVENWQTRFDASVKSVFADLR